MKLGLVFIENTPPHDIAKQMIDYFGYCYCTQYGGDFHVKSKPDPSNISYGAGYLGFHTDQASLLNQPEIQCLHCISQVNEDEGGESHLVDGFEVARQFKEAHPKMYDLLRNYEMEYYEDGEDKYRYNTASRWPVFIEDQFGRLRRIQFSQHQRSWFYDLPVERIHELFVALKTFHDMLYDKENLLDFQLRPGQIMIFDNCRLLHGRGAFKLSNKERNLEGWYLNYDAVKSKLRVLHNQLGMEPNILAM